MERQDHVHTIPLTGEIGKSIMNARSGAVELSRIVQALRPIDGPVPLWRTTMTKTRIAKIGFATGDPAMSEIAISTPWPFVASGNLASNSPSPTAAALAQDQGLNVG
jgi:hypothetical protein